jgi:polyisoprenyl-phosphate glycosyltransferase
MAVPTVPILSIIVPVKDEEDAIAPFVARVGAVLDGLDDPAAKAWEILFVDDGSSDATLAAIVVANQVYPRDQFLT